MWKRQCFHQESEVTPVYIQGGDRRREGVGPTKTSKQKYGNMISGGEVSGKNFLMKETFEYAKKRVAKKSKNETIDGFRLFNNLLSSQPMTFICSIL